MGNRVINLFVLAAIGVMIADLVANPTGTGKIIDGLTNLWKVSVNGMLGKAS
jgi:hypothetical protein